MANNIQFLNNMYIKGGYNRDNEWENDLLYIVYKNTDTGEKKIKRMDEPTITFYKSKENLTKIKTVIPIEDAIPIKCKYRNLIDKMAELIGPEAIKQVKALKEQKKFSYLKEIHHNPNFFSSDVNIEDYWLSEFLNIHSTDNLHLSKGFYDIEVDTIDYNGFPSEDIAPCPINAVTLIDADTKEVFTLLLNNDKNPQIEKMRNNLSKFKKRLHETFDESYPGMNYNIMFFDDELVLIKKFFEIVNELEPDFMSGWNTKFDILTFINRIVNLGGIPADIICHPKFDKKVCQYVKDTKHSMAEDRGDYLLVSSMTQYVDQYLLYCQVRKGQGKKKSYSLNNIAKEELNDTKLDYNEVGTISTLPYEDYELFVLYNIKDVLLCYKIEEVTQDIDFVYNLTLITRTRLNKVMKNSVSIKNLFSKFCRDMGEVLSNNHNDKIDDGKISVVIKDKRFIKELNIQGPVYIPTRINKDIYEKLVKEGYDIEPENMYIEGALVADPKLNKAIGKKMMNRLSKFIFEWVIDFDLASLYPNIIDTFNIEANAQYGRILIPEPSKNIKQRFPDTEDLGGKLLEDYNSRDYVSLGSRYLGTPTLSDFKRRLKEFASRKMGGNK